MPKCPICQKKGILSGRFKKLKARYNPTEKIKKKPNLQWVTVPLNISHKKWQSFKGKRIKVCAKCKKTLKKKILKQK